MTNHRSGNSFVRVMQATADLRAYLAKHGISAEILEIDISKPRPLFVLGYSRALEKLELKVEEATDAGVTLRHFMRGMSIRCFRPRAAEAKLPPARLSRRDRPVEDCTHG